MTAAGHFVYPTLATKIDHNISSGSPQNDAATTTTTATLTASTHGTTAPSTSSNIINNHSQNADQSTTTSTSSTASSQSTSPGSSTVSSTSQSSDNSSNQSSSSSSSSSSNDKSTKSHGRTAPSIHGIGKTQEWRSAILSTSKTNDIAIVALFCFIRDTMENCTNEVPTFSDSAGLSFDQHGSYCHASASANSCIWEFYAIASQPLVDDKIMMMSNVPSRMFVFAVSGADTENVFDPGLPVGTHCPALDEFGNPEAMYTGSACTVSFGSYDPHDLLFEMTMINDASFCTAGPASSSDWTLVDASSSGWSEVNILTSNGTHSFSCDLQHEPVIELVDGIQGAVKEA